MIEFESCSLFMHHARHAACLKGWLQEGIHEKARRIMGFVCHSGGLLGFSDAEPRKITQDEKKFCAEAYHKFCGEYGLDGAALRDCMDRNPVVTLSGESKPIKWIGRERFKKSSKYWPEDFVPVRICRFALDERTPHRDIYLSRNHCIYIDGVLIHAKYLVNGLSITQCAEHPMRSSMESLVSRGSCKSCGAGPLRNVTDPWVGTRATVIRDKIRDRLAARAEELVD
jgi:hypothetical protein